jgi:hypothetical protein
MLDLLPRFRLAKVYDIRRNLSPLFACSLVERGCVSMTVQEKLEERIQELKEREKLILKHNPKLVDIAASPALQRIYGEMTSLAKALSLVKADNTWIERDLANKLAESKERIAQLEGELKTTEGWLRNRNETVKQLEKEKKELKAKRRMLPIKREDKIQN